MFCKSSMMLFAASALRSNFVSSTSVSDVRKGNKTSDHVYELKTYSLKPECYDAFHKLTMEMMPRCPSVGKCEAYWTVQMGALNEFIQLRKYDNLQHRYECMKQLASDKEWHRSYIKVYEPMVNFQSNCLMRMLHREANISTMSYKYMMQISPQQDIELSGPSAILAATFQIIVGDRQGDYVHIVKGHHLDDVIPVHPPSNSSSRILGPCLWSNILGCLWV